MEVQFDGSGVVGWVVWGGAVVFTFVLSFVALVTAFAGLEELRMEDGQVVGAWLMLVGIGVFLMLAFIVLVERDWVMVGIVWTGSLLRVLYLVYTGLFERAYDMAGHLAYLEAIAGGVWPAGQDCNNCYHPQLFYVLAGWLERLLREVGFVNPGRGLQVMMLFLAVLFVVFAVKALRLVISRRWVWYGVGAAVVFWPAMIMSSARVGNDGLLYVWYALGLGCVFYWYLKEKELAFWGALLSGVLAAATKMTGVLLLFTVLLAVVIKMIDRFNARDYVIKIVVASLFVVVGLVLPLSRTLPGYMAGDLPSFVTPNVENLDSQLRVENSWGHFVGLDLNAYRQPYIHASWDETGRQYFWNFMLKTSLFGEFGLEPVVFAQAIGWALLGLVVCLVLMWVTMTIVLFGGRSTRRGFFVLVCGAALVLLLASMADRLMHPFSCSGDFRYIAPILIPLGVLWGWGMQVLREKNMRFLSAVSSGVLGLFVIFSVVLVIFSFEGLQF
jgi:hypothetical protein